MDWTTPDIRRRFRRLRLLPLLACLALLAACSTTSFLYNRLEFLVPWYVDDYVALSAEQDRELERLLAPFLQWHRYQELPRYADLLARAEGMLDEPLTLAEAEVLAREVEIASDRLQTRSLDWLLPLGDRLSDQQVAEFIDNLREQQEELEEEYLERDLAEYREDTYDRLLDNCQDYLGRLDPAQRDILRVAVAELRRFDHLWLEERSRWTGRLEGLLQREPGWQQAVREAVASRWQSSSEDYREMYQHNLGTIQGALVAVIDMRSERQDRRLRRKLGNLREDFLALSREQRQGERGAAEVVGAR
ncbi:DUF6279 family lipoprotein [Parahaliea mediterranea]|uniref:Lipoprotein n=1 Tax=Parahaliea mediterranea TaxID=651086 RepID=A0A939IK86_9GAMM|nr:DUF6279 family lipoprotein [Parahaliea mediterranea]MBN7797071.1 hypothetical protein [Parahaliea mediterranea]